MQFADMLIDLRNGHELSQKDFAASVGVSPQYQHDLEKGRRLPSVEYIEKLCAAFSRGPLGRRQWHLAGARAHGWDVDEPRPTIKRGPFSIDCRR